jgi:hypothetical protein
MAYSLLPTGWIAALLLAACGGCGFYLGGEHANNAWLAKQVAQVQAAAQALALEQARGDALSSGLLVLQGKIDQLRQEAQRAIVTKTTGRACFDSAALGVLGHAPGIALVPQAPGGAVAAHGAAASAADAEPAYASDTQVASWAIDAAALYETCRARLDKLIDWNTAP